MDADLLASPPPRSRWRGAALLGAGAVFGIVVAGLGVSQAQESAPPDAPSTPAQTQQDDNVAPPEQDGAQPPDERRRPGPRPGRPGPGGPRVGKALHGEFVVEQTEGVYVTHVTQHGEVTAVSATSISVRSEDGFSRTYVVNGDTKVNRDGTIAEITQGEQVHVHGVLADGTATAKHIGDGSGRPQRQAPNASASPAATDA